ncbi:hypothetical protein ELS19_01335 [Halogeometricum borinquense]|uniref:Uncharacterized protein n=1 Tax=Halogeometricum borinquense TaxID=60847 RepID=A0A482TFU3_9EURY|nr:hypothetical protein [Halogeometricum borinquense]RYJ12743.1 hypothetical protein ELS19_01335 [Halogeometricum borinquense]
MSEFTDLVLSTTDPVVALLIVGLAIYIRVVHRDLHNDLDLVRGRVRRVETNLLAPDGGQEDDDGR